MSGSVGQGSKSGIIGAKDSTANLSDYETGDFSPNLYDSAGDRSTSSELGSYIRIGALVHIQCYFFTNASSSGTSMRVGNLPFTSASGNQDYASGACSYAENMSITAGHSINARVQKINTYLWLDLWDSTGGVTTLSGSEYGTSGQLQVTVTYRIA